MILNTIRTHICRGSKSGREGVALFGSRPSGSAGRKRRRTKQDPGMVGMGVGTLFMVWYPP